MKVKLLKKIRKRYSITHYPTGVYVHGEYRKGGHTFLTDKEDSWRWESSSKPKEIAYKLLYNTLLEWIRKDYGNLSTKRIVTKETLWHK